MFSRVALSALVLALPLFVAASAIPRTEPVNQCNTGPVQCCDSVKQAGDSGLGGLLTHLDIGSLVGFKCSPITAIGTGGTSCSTQPVCCTNNSFNGVVALGCTPVNLHL